MFAPPRTDHRCYWRWFVFFLFSVAVSPFLCSYLFAYILLRGTGKKNIIKNNKNKRKRHNDCKNLDSKKYCCVQVDISTGVLNCGWLLVESRVLKRLQNQRFLSLTFLEAKCPQLSYWLTTILTALLKGPNIELRSLALSASSFSSFLFSSCSFFSWSYMASLFTSNCTHTPTSTASLSAFSNVFIFFSFCFPTSVFFSFQKIVHREEYKRKYETFASLMDKKKYK